MVLSLTDLLATARVGSEGSAPPGFSQIAAIIAAVLYSFIVGN